MNRESNASLRGTSSVMRSPSTESTTRSVRIMPPARTSFASSPSRTSASMPMKWIHSEVTGRSTSTRSPGWKLEASAHPKSIGAGRYIGVQDRFGGAFLMPRARAVDFQESMRFAGEPDNSALLAAQNDSAARDAQCSRDLVFAGRQHDRARCVVQCRLNARRIVAGLRFEPLGHKGGRQFHPACAISRGGEIHDSISAGIVPVVQAMIRSAEGPLANLLRMQCERGEHPESSPHTLSLSAASTH